ncbi:MULTISPECIES: DHA2 family efflux MFS transporter permease subunit [unclassified Frankia]|uniref:DHA2 family efflux MFS transporter permease subunit n=1 Tax=unclassified Frankia TaxID=2632575 RepID=UPI001EF4AB98|nr:MULTISPECIES: DHA2 family efflux MFS transporter permease subunit [unclassified Frankia]
MALSVLVIGYFMVVLDMTIVAVASPKIVDGLHADIPAVVWATSAYLLVFAVALLPAGRLGDRFGPRDVYLAGLALFTVASLACGLSSTIGTLIAARAAQGLGAALVTPQTMAVIARTFPPGRRAAAMSLWGGVAGLANLVGPLAGGVLVDQLGWEWIFFVNVPLGVVGLVAASRFVPALPGGGRGFDVVGVLLSAAGLALLVFGLQEGDSWHWSYGVWLMIVTGLVVLAAFVVQQARGAPEPLLPLSLFRDRNFGLATAAVAAAGAAVPAVMVPLYFYLEAVRNLSGSRSGLVVAPMAIFAMLFVPFVAKFGDRTHPRSIPGAGFALFAVTLLVFAALMTPGSPVVVFLTGAAVTGIANACLWPTLAATATRDLPVAAAGAAAGAYNAVRQFGSVLGSAAVSAVIASRMAAHGLDADAVVDGGSVTGIMTPAVRHAFGSALGESMYLPAAILALGLVAAALFVRAPEPEPASRPVPVPTSVTAGERLDDR